MSKPQAERGYHHGDLRETLLNAALESIQASGTEKLSLRALAREAGVSATAPYRHFPSKQSLLAALVTRGFRGLERQSAAARDAAGDDPEARLLAVGLAYVNFALENPTAYQLMFGTVLGDFSEYEDLSQAAEAAYGVVRGVLETLLEHRRSTLSISEAGGIAWAAVHGVASLLLFGRDHRRSASGPRNALVDLERDHAGALRRLLRGLIG